MYTGQPSTLLMLALVQYSKPQMPVHPPAHLGRSGHIPLVPESSFQMLDRSALNPSLLLAAQKETAVIGQRSDQPNAPNARCLTETHLNNNNNKNTTHFGEAQRVLMTQAILQFHFLFRFYPREPRRRKATVSCLGVLIYRMQ